MCKQEVNINTALDEQEITLMKNSYVDVVSVDRRVAGATEDQIVHHLRTHDVT